MANINIYVNNKTGRCLVLRQNPEFSEMKLLPAFLALSGVFAQYDDSSSSDPESASDYSGSSSPDDIDDGYGGRWVLNDL